MYRAYSAYLESKRDPDDPDPKKRRVVPDDRLSTMLRELDANDTCLKDVYLDIKNLRERGQRVIQETTLAPEPSPGFHCDTDFAPTKQSQIICGDSLELMKRWARLLAGRRPAPHTIFGSPPYWLPRPNDQQESRRRHRQDSVREARSGDVGTLGREVVRGLR